MKFTAILAGLVYVATCGSAGAIIYQLEPRNLSGGGNPPHQVTTGFIETDGTLGQLDRNAIIDYELNVEGAFAFTFSAADPTASISQLGALIATPTSIVIPAIQTPNGRNELIFGASDSSHVDCSNCTQALAWYQVRDFQGNQSSNVFLFRDVDFNPDIDPFWFRDTGVDITIATAVPESDGLAWLPILVPWLARSQVRRR